MTATGYLTNLGKYNEGELIGTWITFPVNETDLNTIFRWIGMKYTDESGVVHNAQYEEYFFTDWDGEAFGEYVSISRMNEIAEMLKDWDEDTLEAARELYGDDVDLSRPEDYFLSPDISTDEGLGYHYAIELQSVEIPKNILFYFDFEAYGRDIRLTADGGFTSRGWLERFV